METSLVLLLLQKWASVPSLDIITSCIIFYVSFPDFIMCASNILSFQIYTELFLSKLNSCNSKSANLGPKPGKMEGMCSVVKANFEKISHFFKHELHGES